MNAGLSECIHKLCYFNLKELIDYYPRTKL